ncbi:hypothetical protein K501DRAFT_336391 [Backusella circina FSU 941]|nr:hypothetical protein K501DRAFT_336391 [Backusella circina FSU 941]
MPDKRKRTTKSENKIKKINSYFKPVQSDVQALDSPEFKKVKLKTRTLLKQNLVSNELDQKNEEKEESKVATAEKDEEEKVVVVEEEEKEEKEESKTAKVEEEKDTPNEHDTSNPPSLQIKITETQELDTQNVPIFNTQTQTDTVIGSPITYTFAGDDDEEDDFFDLPKLVNSQIDNELILSSTQESSLDDFEDILDPQSVNIISLDQNTGLSQTDSDFKISTNLPDTNTSIPSSTL